MITLKQHLGRVLLDGLRSALLLKPRPEAFETTLPVVVMLCLLTMGATAAFEYALSGGNAWFNSQGIVIFIANGVGALVLYLSLLPFRRAGAAPHRLFAGVMATSFVILLAAAAGAVAVRTYPPRLPENWAAYIPSGLIIVLALLAIVSARLGYGLAARARALVGAGLVAVLLAASITFPKAPIFLGRETKPSEFSLLQAVVDLVRPPEPPDEEDEQERLRPRIDAEAVFAKQPALLAQTLSALEPPRDDRPEYYFLGMAPYASQDVFKREITAVKSLFDERFGTAGRSLALINHRDTVNDTPLASMTNLDLALRHLGRLMRADRDVLVLFITSHGAKGQIAVSFPGFPLNGMTPERLATSLDAAGVVNRVLVLSACHSGSFVDRLKNDHTLILAAAHADKTSFGCSNENEWTYFGDAYFNRTLRTETSLVDAFGSARTLIEQWEKRDKLEPSEPQISIGAAIKARLDAVTASRSGRAQ